MKISEKPSALYNKIKSSVIDDIQSGNLQPEDKILSENELAKQFNVSRMTANRALKELAEEGWILRMQGIGSFVGIPKPEAALLEIKSIAKEIVEWGGVHSSKVLCLEEEAVREDVAHEMDLSAEDNVFHSILLHKNRGFPVQYSERFVNPKVAPDYIKQNFDKITPSDYLLSVAPIQKAEHIIEAVKCKSDVCEALKIDLDEPCLSLTRRTWSNNMVATYSVLISPGSKYKLLGKFMRN